MLKVFLVEDEIIVRNSIKKNIDWDREGFEFTGEAGDGELAFPMIKKIQPDIIITDIKMPFMNGLELSRLVKNDMPDVKIIVLSGYDEFEYAKEAISIGVTDYLLKPIDSQKIIEVLRRVAIIIAEEREKDADIERYQQEKHENLCYEKTKLFLDIINKKSSYLEIITRGRKLNIYLTSQYYIIMLFQVFCDKDIDAVDADVMDVYEKIMELCVNNSDVNIFERGTEGLAILLQGTDEVYIGELKKSFTNKILNILENFKHIKYYIGIGKPVKRLGEIAESFNTANKLFCYRYLTDTNRIMDYMVDIGQNIILMNDNDTINLNSLNLKKIGNQALLGFLRRGTVDEVELFINELFDSLGTTNTNSYIFRQYIGMDWNLVVLSFIDECGGERKDILGDDMQVHELVSSLNSVQSFRKYLTNIVSKAIQMRIGLASRKYSELLLKAKDYIKNNYNNEDISLNSVAASVNISPSHFSSIFSQEEEMTFVEYLTWVRMDKAKELLRCTSKKSTEIAYEVGYKDVHYFAYIFKKTQHITPSDYRTNGMKL